jgi:hypothetical protein
MAYEDESKKLSDAEESELLEEAKERWEECDNHYADMYKEATEDWQFLHGDGQWDTGSENVRSKDGRPSLILNQCLPYAHQITNDIKQARLAIRVVPVDSEADIETAEVRAGIIRNVEKQSKCKTVYGTAAMNAIGAGIGWMRVDVDYADNDTFEQEAYVKRVLDFTAVMLDPSDTTLDGSEADYGFDSSDLTYSFEKFEELYPGEAAVSFEGENSRGGDGEDEVSLVRYYYRERQKKVLHEINVMGEIGQVFAEDLKLLDENGVAYEKLRSREVDDYKVYHCILSGEAVLSREEFPCHYIPLVPVIGEEYYNNGKREFHSLIRQAKDAQRMYNYWKSASTEMIALQPKAPWTGPVGSFQSYPDDWANANTQNLPTLEYDAVYDENTGQMLPPPQRSQPIMGSPAMMQEAVGARDDIRLALGIPQSNMGERSNAVSGIAIRSQQIEGDNATFHFIDNLSSSIAQVGRILNDIIPIIYSDRKVTRIIGDNGDEENIPVNSPYVKGEEGIRSARYGEAPDGVHDLSVGKYDIDMDVGPSYASGRQEAADKLTQIAEKNPELYGVAGDLIIEVMDIPMGKEISERIKSQMDPALLGDDPQAAKLQEASQALQQMQEQLANMDAALQDKEGNEKFDQAVKAEEQQLERDKFEVDAQKTKADIDKIYADIQGGVLGAQAANTNIEAVTSKINEMEETIGIILMDREERDAEENMATSEPVESDAMLEKGENNDSTI